MYNSYIAYFTWIKGMLLSLSMLMAFVVISSIMII